MPKYRKKPVVIEAIQVPNPTNFNAIYQLGKWIGEKTQTFLPSYTSNGELRIHTLEGEMFAHPGDWIIEGVQGELYPCKPDIFALTYEKVED